MCIRDSTYNVRFLPLTIISKSQLLYFINPIPKLMKRLAFFLIGTLLWIGCSPTDDSPTPNDPDTTNPVTNGAVSYTHLDVYKRQLINRYFLSSVY